jgi:hypothetical protein
MDMHKTSAINVRSQLSLIDVNLKAVAFNRGSDTFETGSPSLFLQGTRHEQECNSVRYSSEGDIEGGVEAGNDAKDFEETKRVSKELPRNISIKNIVTLNPKTKADPLHKGTFLYNMPHLTKANLSKNIEFIIHLSSRRGEYVSLILATMSEIGGKRLTCHYQRCSRCSGRNPTEKLGQMLNQLLLAPTKYLLGTQSLAKKYIPLFGVSLLPRRRRAIPCACKYLSIIYTCKRGY